MALTPQAIRGVWGRFTHEFLLFVADAAKRRDRVSVTRKWKKIQACGELLPAQPIVADVGIEATQLYKQAAGCLATATAKAGLEDVEEEIKRLTESAAAEAELQIRERIDRAGAQLHRLKSRLNEGTVSEELQSEVAEFGKRALKKRRTARAFIEDVNQESSTSRGCSNGIL